MSDYNEHQVRNRITGELSAAGALNWPVEEQGTEQETKRLHKATIEVVRIVQTLAKEIDLLYAEIERLKREPGGTNGA